MKPLICIAAGCLLIVWVFGYRFGDGLAGPSFVGMLATLGVWQWYGGRVVRWRGSCK